MSSRPAAEPPRGLRVALSLNTAAFLLLEVGLQRTLAVAAWYHLAFLVVSLALLGGGLGPLLLARRPAAPSPRTVARVLLAAPWVALGGFLAWNALPFEPFRLLTEPAQWGWVPLGVLALAAPFAVSGWVTAALFAVAPQATRRLYLLDLLGAAAGAVAFPLVVAPLPGAGDAGAVWAAVGLWGLAGLAALRGAGTAQAGRGGSAGPRWWDGWGKWWLPAAGLAALAVAAVGLTRGRALVPVRISADKEIGGLPAARVLADPKLTPVTRAGAAARVDVVRTRDGFRLVLDGGTAVSRLVSPLVARRSSPVVRTILAAVGPRAVLVAGSGGGLEVRQALDAGAARVVAVELNPTINALVRGPYDRLLGGLFHDPRVSLHTDEVRAFLAGSRQRFDALVAVHTISNAALAGGGLSLAESYAMTAEAFASYARHLRAGGVLLVTRPRFQLGRLAETAAAGWRLAGLGSLAPRALVVTRRTDSSRRSGGSSPARAAADRFFGALVVGRDPLEPALVEGLRRALEGRGYAVVAGEEALRVARGAGAGGLLTPATDDRPFFNQRRGVGDVGWADLQASFRGDARLALEDRPVAEVTVWALLVQVGLLALLLYLGPLVVGFVRRARDRRRSPVPSLGPSLGPALAPSLANTAPGSLPEPPGLTAAEGLYFALLGLGFLLFEVSSLQRLQRVLGRPDVAFPVVLGAVLLGAGLGGGWTVARVGTKTKTRVAGRAARVRNLVSRLGRGLILPAALLVTALALDPALDLLASAPLWARVAGAVALVAPASFLLGRPFPRGLSWLRGRAPAVGWAFAYNGVASVLGSIVAVLVAMAWGLRAVGLVVAGVYLVAGALAAWVEARQGRGG